MPRNNIRSDPQRDPTSKKYIPVGRQNIRSDPKPKKRKTTMTKQEYLQETSDTKRDIAQQKAEVETAIAGIDPGATYKYDGRTMSGSTLINIYKTKYLTQYEDAEIQSQIAWSEARDLPEGTTITKTNKGYKFNFRDGSLDWSKGEFKKIDKAYKINPVLGAVSEFGFGAVSSWGALFKPIVFDPLIGNERSRRSHFVSPFDFVFEPIGWSPKGSTKIMKERPIFTAGGIGAEVVQSYALTQVFKPVAAGVKIGAKGIIKRVPVAYGKFTKVFPEEKFISKGVTGTKKVFAKGSSDLPQNIYRWGAKGYKKGLELTSAGVKTTSKEVPGVADDVIRTVTQKTRYGKGGVKRVWLSPTEFAKAQDDIAAKLALKKTVEKSYRVRIKAGLGKASELIEVDKYRLNWSGKRLVRNYKFTRQTWNIGDELFWKPQKNIIKSSGDDTYKGFTRLALEGAGEPTQPSGWFAIHKKMLTEGYGVPALKKQMQWIPLEHGGYLSGKMYERPAKFFKGFGSAGFKPTPKKWITNYRPPFLKNIQAQTSVTLQNVKTKLITPSTKIGHRLDLLPKLYTATIPSSMYKSGLELGVYPVFKTIPRVKTRYDVRQTVITTPRTKQTPILKIGRLQVLDKISLSATEQKKALDYKHIMDVVTVPQYEQKKVAAAKVPFVTPAVKLPVPFLFPGVGLYGRGTRFYGDKYYRKKYKFRKYEVPDLSKIIGKVGF